jgi:steroid 5-alpha reductase family enzyme
MSAPASLLTAVVAIAILMVATWLVSIAIRNASIVDIVWGSGFVVVAITTHVRDDTTGALDWLVTVLVAAWGLRLSAHLGIRNHGGGEDFRYRAMRKRWGPRFWLISLLTVFVLQGVLMWVVSLPVQLVRAGTSPGIGVFAVIGAFVAVCGLAIETTADIQLRAFRADPSNAGKVMDRGLWAWTRHPNYFGDVVFWWGVVIAVLSVGVAWWGIIGGTLMNFLLVQVSGVAMLERSLSKRKEGWDDYVRRTPAFLPRPPAR